MARIVDARGLPCPQPVILTRNALKEEASVTTIVDNETARRNVTRMAERAGASVRAEERGDETHLLITRVEAPPEAIPSQLVSGTSGATLVLLVPSDAMGRGDAELGRILMRSFFHTLGEVEALPRVIIFFNGGVKLVAEGSPILEDLQALRGRGIEILACGTCLGYYGLRDKVVVGEVSNMYTIAETMLGGGKVVSL
jgi:selenium metabolism protein YedF